MTIFSTQEKETALRKSAVFMDQDELYTTVVYLQEECERLLDVNLEMLQVLKTTETNIRSLGPAGIISDVPYPFRKWLEIVQAAITMAEKP